MSILIHKETTVIIQGITGREAVSMTREGLSYGTKIVGGVTPGRAGRASSGPGSRGRPRRFTACSGDSSRRSPSAGSRRKTDPFART